MNSRQLRAALLASGAAFVMTGALGGAAAADESAAGQRAALQRQLDQLQERMARIEARRSAERRIAPAAAVEAGARPRTWKLPGTNTSMLIGGYAKLDFIYDINGAAGDLLSGDANSGSYPREGTAGAALQNNFRLHANHSRIFIRTWTPTEWGTLATRIEGDFFGSGGGILRLRHAYGQLGPVLAGQTNSGFRLPSLEPDTFEPNGPIATYAVRNPQVRYTHKFGGGTSFRVTVENPRTSEITYATGFAPTNAGATAHIPDFTGALEHKWSSGYAALAVVLGEGGIDNGAGVSDYTMRWGFTGGIKYMFNRKRTTVALYGFISSFFRGRGPDVLITGTNGTNIDLKAPRAYGVQAWVQHKWTDTLRSNVMFGRHDVDVEDVVAKGLIPAGTADFTWGVHANLIWSPIKPVDIGVEYIYRFGSLHNSTGYTVHRILGAMKYKF
jgi:hypothetical protein